jgi:hypothetical protein
MSLHLFPDLVQGSTEWHEARCGIVTASVLKSLLTAGGQVADNETSRGLTHQVTAERISGFVDPTYASVDMERGHWDEPLARAVYEEHYAPVTPMGFMVRDDWGFSIGYSPDGLVGDNGLIEIKSRRSKEQVHTIVTDEVPAANRVQLQAGLLVSGREWIDYLSFCAGLPMFVKRVHPDEQMQGMIVAAVTKFEENAEAIEADFAKAVTNLGLHPTERIPDIPEMQVS